MDVTVIPFCGYPICRIKTDKKLNKKELSFFNQLQKKRHKNVNLSLTDSDNILNNKEFTNVRNFILEYFSHYVNNILEIKNNFVMCNSWGTTQKKGDSHPLHTHKNAFFSSVYYVETTNSSIFFEVDKAKIQEGFYIEYNIKNYNYFNSASWELEVESGDLVIFPGELAHHTDVNEKNYTRKIIGSSYFIKDKIGSVENYNSVII
tara:strand:+ start:1989 stop:2603 length:615 start_codon:yes stop_codon:yes gene_type:complete